MEQSSGKYALITGATSGIGYELTQLFAKDGHNVILVARTEDRLQQVANEITTKYGVEAIVIAKDLFRPEAAKELFDEITRRGITVTFLVNDAGQGEYGLFAETDIRRQLDIIQLNITSLVYLSRLFLDGMLKRDEGKILNVSSMAGKMPTPLLAVYAATKAFVYSFTQSLVNELKGTDVTATALLPGATETDFFYKAGAENTKEWRVNDLADPAKVAKDGYDAMMHGADKVISGFKNKIMVAMSNILPDTTLADKMRDNHMAPAERETEDRRTAHGARLAASMPSAEEQDEPTQIEYDHLPPGTKHENEPRKNVRE